MVQNLWDKAKAIIRGNFIVIQSYLKKQEKNSNKQANLTPEAMKEQTKLKVSTRKETIKIRAEINEIETKKIITKINETKNGLFEKMNKTDKPLARLIKNKKGEDSNQ